MKKAVCSAVIGFLAAAAFAAIALPSLILIGAGSFDVAAGLKASVGFFPFALVVVVILGVPTFLLLRPFRPGHWSMPLIAGTILGLLLLLVLDLALGGGFTFLLVLTVVSLSALSALVFWLVWRWADEREGGCCAS